MRAEKRTIEINIAMRRLLLNLDVDDLPDEIISEDLADDREADQVSAVLILSHSLQVPGRDHQQSDHCENWHQHQNRRGEPAVRAGRFHLTFQTEALADYICKLGQDFREVTTGLFLQQ